MGVFGAFFGCRGDAGFKAPLLGVSSGVVGFNVATLSRLVREKVRPAWPDVCVSVKKFAQRTNNGPKWAFSGVLGEFFRGSAAGGAVLGEFFRGNAAGGAVLGEFADQQSWDPTGRTLLRRSPGRRPSTGSVNPSIRSYTHLAGPPPQPQQPSPQRKALTKGKCLPVKAVTSLDNGRKWRVSAGRTLELLR